MKILFTGASGFLGQNTIPLLQNEGKYSIVKIGLTYDDDYKINLSEEIPEIGADFDVVLHAAGKAHSIPNSKDEAQSFFDVNLNGTQNLCAALEQSALPKSFIFVSTVAVYGIEKGENITEDYALNGTSPYALSKIQAEVFLQEWCSKHNVVLSIIRPSLIAGKNPPGNLGAMIQGIKTGKYFSIAKGEARKSVLMAEDIVRLLPKLISTGGVYNVCDNHHPSFGELEILIASQLSKQTPYSIPYWLAKTMALIGDIVGVKAPINSSKLDKITNSLTFSNNKAKTTLNWEPIDVLNNFKIS